MLILSSVFDHFDEEVFHRCRFYVDSLPNLQIVMLYRIRLLWIAYILDCSMQKFDLALDNLYTVRNSRYHLYIFYASPFIHGNCNFYRFKSSSNRRMVHA